MSDDAEGPYYVANGTDHQLTYHSDANCHPLEEVEVERHQEPPSSAAPCTFCAGGVRARDIIEDGNRARGGADE